MIAAALLVFTAFFAQAQEREPFIPQFQTTTAVAPPNKVSPFSLTSEKSGFGHVVKEATYLQLDAAQLEAELKNAPRELHFVIPQKDGKNIELMLEKQEILAPDFSVKDARGNTVPWKPGVYYAGHVLDRVHGSQTLAALSVTDGEVMAMMTVNGKNHVLGTLRDNRGKKTSDYVLYSDNDLLLANTITCETDHKHVLDNPMTSGIAKSSTGKNIVRVQLEADNQMYQDFGNSIANVSAYLTGMYNVVATIYHRESIVTQISQIIVWNIADPYEISSSVSSSYVLGKYRDRKNLTGITGDLGHLLSTKLVGHGGVAWVDVLCHPTVGYRTAYSNIAATYNNFPLYSWTIDVVTHEMGHNLGSRHTHDCVWGPSNNQALDNCASPSGGCAAGPAPVNGGTIMSYCHLTAGGKNFMLGFGSQPGNLIRNKVSAASCLQKAHLNCSGALPIYCGVPVSGSTVGAPSNVNTYGCNSWLQSGPERVYVLNTTEAGTITASLSNLTADLDVIILGAACSESNCLAAGNNVATVANAPAGQYFIVVEGYQGAAGSFTLTVNCSGVCFATGTTNLEFIQSVSFGSINNNSGNNYGYADFTGMSTPVQRGTSLPVTLTPGFNSGTWNQHWRIWIDLNGDNDFNDYGELVFETGAASSTTVNGAMNIPAWATPGPKRMRVAMRYGTKPTPCGIFSGEVEDYTIVIQDYCPSLGKTSFEFIQRVEIGSLNNNSGNNGGYADFTSLPALGLIKGETVPLTLTPGFPGANYGERWAVWIDFNQDRNFDASELVFSGGPSALPVSGDFAVPNSALSGTTRMRVTMYYGSNPGSCSYGFSGETEDYLVEISSFCPSSGISNFEFIQTVGIGSLLNESGNDGGYADFTDLTAEVSAVAPVPLVLVPGFAEKKYPEYWRVWIDFNNNKKFEPSELVFQAGPSADLIFGTFTIPDGVTEGEYGCRVSMRYGGFPEPCGNIGWGEVEDYTVMIIGGEKSAGITDRSDSPALPTAFAGASVNTGDFTLFPNPAKAVVNISWDNVLPISGQVVNLTGQVVHAFDGASIPTKIEVADLPSGLYLFQVITEDKQVMTKRFVKVE